MSSSPSPTRVLEVVDTLGPPGTPLTTSEVAAEFDCTDRTIYNRLDALVEDGSLETKKVGARGRVWWRPVDGDIRQNGGAFGQRGPVSLRNGQAPASLTDSEMAERIREFEWADTSLGPMIEWPQELQVAVDIMLGADEAIGIYWGEDLTLLYNDAARERIGKKHPNVLGRPAREVFPEAWEVLSSMHERVMAGEGAVRVEEQYLPIERGDTVEDVWWDSSFNPIPGVNGSVGGVFNVSVDVTDRVQTESELRERKRESEERYRTLFESIDEGFAIIEVSFDEDGEQEDYRFLETNPAFEEVTGLSDVEGTHRRDLESGYDPQFFNIYGEVAQTGESRRFEANGEPLIEGWYDVSIIPYGEEDSGRVALLIDDITDRKRTERQLKTEKEQLDVAVKNSPLTLFRLDTDLRYTWIRNPNGFEPGDILGKRDDELLPPESAETVTAPKRRALEAGEHVREEVTYELPSGQVTYDLTASPIRDESGEITGLICAAHDITERKEAEQKLATELEAMKRLQEVSTQSIQQDDGEMLYESVLDTAMDLLDAEFGTIQRLDPQIYELDMFAYRGFSAETIARWDRVDVETPSSCGRALQMEERVIVPDVETCEFIDEGEDLEAFTRVGIRSMQSTPLISRSGELLGMLSTHWTAPHELSERDRHLLDVLARQVADLMQQQSMIEELRTSEERLTAATNAAEIGVWELDLRTGKELYTSPRYAEILGYDELPDDWSLEHALEHYHPDDRERLETYLEDGLGEWTFESRITRVDGEQRWISVESTAYEDDDGSPMRAVGTMLDITERKESEKELRESRERYRTLFESIDEGFCIIEMLFDEDDDPVDYRFLETNPAFEEQTGLTDAEGELMRDLEPESEDHWFETYGRVARTGEPEHFHEQTEQLGGRWYSLSAFRIGDPEERRVAVVFSDISDIKYPQEALKRLTDASRELMEADTETLQDRVVKLTVDVFKADSAALWRYDEASGELTETTSTLAASIDADSVHHPDDITELAWQTFVADEIVVNNDLSVAETVPDGATLRSRLLVPLGRHGVVCVNSLQSNVFEEWVIDLAETFGATLETAWDRADSEHRLQAQNQELQRLDRLNTLIRSLDQALVGADTREEIDEAVCKQLASSDLYASAWLATYDADTDTLRPQAWAGIDSRYLDDRTVTVGDGLSDDPLVTAHRIREVQVIPDIAVDARAASWREAALERGVRSCINIPLVYEESIYGILTVYGRTPQPDDHEMEVLGELGQTIAYAINALEATTTRRTDSVVELTLRTREATTPLASLARETDCTIDIKGLVPNATGEDFTVFFEATGVSPDELLTAGDQVLAIEDLDCLEVYENEDDEGGLFRARLTESHLVSVLLTQEAAVRSIAIEAGIVTIVIDLPESTVVSEFVDEFRQHLPDVELLARTTRSRPFETQYSLRTSVEDRLTARQREILRIAYESGFFESPRVQTGKQLSDTLDISQSTFTYHLRESQRRLCEMVFDHA